MSKANKEWLKTIQEAVMVCQLLTALDLKRKRDGPAYAWLTYHQATSEVLSNFDPGAARHFIDKLRDKHNCAFEYLRDTEGKGDTDVFHFTFEAEQKIREKLLRLADLLFQIFPDFLNQAAPTQSFEKVSTRPATKSRALLREILGGSSSTSISAISSGT